MGVYIIIPLKLRPRPPIRAVAIPSFLSSTTDDFYSDIFKTLIRWPRDFIIDAPDKAEVSCSSTADLKFLLSDFSRIAWNSPWTFVYSLTVVSFIKEAASLVFESISLADTYCFRVSVGLKLCYSLFLVGYFSTVTTSWVSGRGTSIS